MPHREFGRLDDLLPSPLHAAVHLIDPAGDFGRLKKKRPRWGLVPRQALPRCLLRELFQKPSKLHAKVAAMRLAGLPHGCIFDFGISSAMAAVAINRAPKMVAGITASGPFLHVPITDHAVGITHDQRVAERRIAADRHAVIAVQLGRMEQQSDRTQLDCARVIGK